MHEKHVKRVPYTVSKQLPPLRILQLTDGLRDRQTLLISHCMIYSMVVKKNQGAKPYKHLQSQGQVQVKNDLPL